MRPITLLDNENGSGKVALLRVDYNVPIQDGKVADDLRIRASIKTIEYLRAKGFKIILISHIEGKGSNSLAPVAEKINEGEYPFTVNFESEIPSSDHGMLMAQIEKFKNEKLAKASDGSVFLFENLRNNAGEKNNSQEFANTLAGVADIFVGDAFSVSHRNHASIVALPACFPDAHYAGFQIIDEVGHLTEGIHPPHPFIFILGGAKFDTKLPLIQKIIVHADNIVIGGALLNDILKAQGLEIGQSLVSDVSKRTDDLVSLYRDSRLILPDDVVVKENLDNDGDSAADKSGAEKTVKPIWAIGQEDTVMDVGPSIIAKLKEIFDTYKNEGKQPFVLWNGPMGNYELGYKETTIALLKLLIDEKVKALLGGGDTSAAITEGGLSDVIASDPEIKNLIYISTGGGAMIDYLINETLPGIEALK